MLNEEKLRQRFLSDPLPIRLGGLSATLGRISSSARVSESPAAVVADLLDEAKHLIEWTAAEAEPETAAELVQIQRLIVLWQKGWGTSASDRTQQVLLSTLAKSWSDKVLESSGLLL
ncbi:MAG: hypothetical protein V1800_09665 [Candidatus Latescibacterota bacterium]